MQKRRPSRDAVFVIPLTGLDCYGSAIRMSILILAALALHVIPAAERESPVYRQNTCYTIL